jgi:hypothetical protein
MVTRITDDYTNCDARTFDPALRQHAPATAQFLFDNTKDDLAPGATFENVEFDTECKQRGNPHGPDCEIGYVTVRRRSDGPNGNDVVAGIPERIGADHMARIIHAHNVAYAQ